MEGGAEGGSWVKTRKTESHLCSAALPSEPYSSAGGQQVALWLQKEGNIRPQRRQGWAELGRDKALSPSSAP